MFAGPVSKPRSGAPETAGEHRQVRDAAQIEDSALDSRGGEHRPVERRSERRTLPSRGDIAPAKVRHRGDTRTLGNDVRITELHGAWQRRRRRVVHRLAVAADGRDVAHADPRDVEQLPHRVREQRPESHVGVPEPERGARRILGQGVKLALQIAGDGRRMGRDGGGDGADSGVGTGDGAVERH